MNSKSYQIVSSLHDSRILGIEYEPSALALALKVLDDTGRVSKVTWQGVMHWELDPFEIENIVFELRIHPIGVLPEHLSAEYPDYVKAALKGGGVRVFELDPTMGMGGTIVAAQCTSSIM